MYNVLVCVFISACVLEHLDSILCSFGRYDHEDWCSHKVAYHHVLLIHVHNIVYSNVVTTCPQSMLCMWNLDMRSLDSKRAHVSIDVPVS